MSAPSDEVLPLRPLPLSGPTEDERRRLDKPVDEQLLAIIREMELLGIGLRNLSEAEGRRHKATAARVGRLELRLASMEGKLDALIELVKHRKVPPPGKK